MAIARDDTRCSGHGRPGPRPRSRHHDRSVLADVVPLWPAPPARKLNSKLARVIASLRARATPEGTPPTPPPPAPHVHLAPPYAAAPDDAA